MRSAPLPPSVGCRVAGRGKHGAGGACALQPSPPPAHSVFTSSLSPASALPQRALPRRTRRHRAHCGAAQAGARLPFPPPHGRQGTGLPLRPHNPPPHASPSLRGVRGLVWLAGGSAPRHTLMRLQMLIQLQPLFMQPFTNVDSVATVVYATFYKCAVILAALNGLTPHEVAAPTKKRRAERPTTTGK